MGNIKRRRLQLPVLCHPGTVVGGYVPFNLCPRSVMLYVIHCANHPDLTYREGQGQIVHLEADLRQAVRWAEANRRRWAFSRSNASAFYAQFRSNLGQLDEVNWTAVAATYFRPDDIKEGKQAEFLVERCFAWELVERVGVLSPAVGHKATIAIQGTAHRPRIEVLPSWYY